jgi:hypothetical protein
MSYVPWNGLLGGTVGIGSPVAVAMGALLIGLLVVAGPLPLMRSIPRGGGPCTCRSCLLRRDPRRQNQGAYA